jgi:hypothetical protein
VIITSTPDFDVLRCSNDVNFYVILVTVVGIELSFRLCQFRNRVLFEVPASGANVMIFNIFLKKWQRLGILKQKAKIDHNIGFQN